MTPPRRNGIPLCEDTHPFDGVQCARPAGHEGGHDPDPEYIPWTDDLDDQVEDGAA